MKRLTILLAVVGICTAAVCTGSCAQGTAGREPSKARVAAAPHAQFSDGLIYSIEPMGWLKECLQRQADGLTGHPKALSYPYTSCLWAGVISREGSHGSDWWRYEQTAYYSDGLLRLGYELRDSALIAKGQAGVEYTLSHATENGILGVWSPFMLEGDNYSQWPFAVYFRVIQAMYQATGDERIPPALEKHFLNFSPEYYKSRSAVNIEGVLWTYSITGNPQLLELAEKAWEQGSLYLNQERCLSDEPLYQHGVTFCEELKLPILMYAYTGKEKYKEQALHAQKLLEDEHILPDGVPSSAEYLLGHSPIVSHETCDITDYTWTLGYFLMATGQAKWADKIEKAVFNAGLGCVTKDFKQLQYFSSVNQFIATGTSNNNEFMHGRTWMAFRPTHQTECCAGNVHRIMPNYVARMWMRGKADNSVVAAMYGPSRVSLMLSDSTLCTITEATEYPFSDQVRFCFEFSRNGSTVSAHDLEFSFRAPEGSSVAGNYDFGADGFATIRKNFRSGENLTLRFEAAPEVKSTEGGVYIQRGPLVYALAIPADVAKDTTTYSYMNGKKPEEPGFDCLNLTPAGSWRWALQAGIKPSFTRKRSSGYPWENPPVNITIPANAISGWELADGQFTTLAPDPLVPDTASQSLTLVPYGSTLLRLTVFPVLPKQ